jgi:pyruvate dehydrogenase E2 component (dihydrolipoamide acetyltransferase)
MFTIQLARQGQTMEQGTIIQWKKRAGDDMNIGEELYEIETEKAIVPIEVTRPGRLLKLLVSAGDTVTVGTVLAFAADPGEQVAASQLEAAIRRGVVDEQPATTSVPAIEAASKGRGKQTAVPKARSLARELGVDLAEVQGSGGEGVILPEDVRRAAAKAHGQANGAVPAGTVFTGHNPGQNPKISRRVPLSPIARAGIAALERAWQTPQFTQGILVDASGLLRAKSNSENFSYMDYFLDAIVRAAHAVPDVLARVGDAEILYYDSIDISIATATDRGLLIPVLRNAGAFSLAQRAPAWREVIEGARTGRLAPHQMTGGLVALSNLGTRGVDYGTPLLPVGHSAIVFVGALAPRPIVAGERLEVRPSLHVAITYDHRVVDGVLGSRFTSAINEALIEPGT